MPCNLYGGSYRLQTHFFRDDCRYSPCTADSLTVGRDLLQRAGITQDSEIVLNTESLNRSKPPDFVIVSFFSCI